MPKVFGMNKTMAAACKHGDLVYVVFRHNKTFYKYAMAQVLTYTKDANRVQTVELHITETINRANVPAGLPTVDEIPSRIFWVNKRNEDGWQVYTADPTGTRIICM